VAGREVSDGQIQVLQVPGVPLVPRLMRLLEERRADDGNTPAAEVLVGDGPSPTLVIDGVDVTTGRTVAQTVVGSTCRQRRQRDEFGRPSNTSTRPGAVRASRLTRASTGSHGADTRIGDCDD